MMQVGLYSADMNEQTGQQNDAMPKEWLQRVGEVVDPVPRVEPFAAQRGQPQSKVQGKRGLCPAAVLVPIVNRPGQPHVLLTKRAEDHVHHAGQISFPGGKIASQDKNIEAAALRETLEETGVEPCHIEVLGHLDAHSTGTGFTIFPVVGLLEPSFCLKPCAREVAEIFEVPFSFLLQAENYRVEKIFWRGRRREFYVIDYGTYRIWGATAAILKRLQERLFRQI